MKKLALCIAATAALSSSAFAADLPVKAPPMAVAPLFSWTGFYIGVNGGGAWSPDRTIFLDETFNSAPFFSGVFGTRRAEGGFGGVQVGYNWQQGPWVFGFEGDAQGSSIRGSSFATVTPYVDTLNSITLGTTERLDYFATIRGRVGYAWDRVLLYVTGGGAVGQTRTTLAMTDTFGFAAANTNTTLRGGFTVGAGGEYAFSPNWSAKIEYQYIDLGRGSFHAQEFTGAAPSTFFIFNSNRFDYHTVRFGLNYKWGGPVVANY